MWKHKDNAYDLVKTKCSRIFIAKKEYFLKILFTFQEEQAKEETFKLNTQLCSLVYREFCFSEIYRLKNLTYAVLKWHLSVWISTSGSASIETGNIWGSWYRMHLYFIYGIYEKYILNI